MIIDSNYILGDLIAEEKGKIAKPMSIRRQKRRNKDRNFFFSKRKV